MKFGKLDKKHLSVHATRLKSHLKAKAKLVHRHALSTPKKIVISYVAVLFFVIIIAQFAYPSNRIVLFESVDGVAIGGVKKDEAVKKLNALYGGAKVPIYYKDDDTLKAQPSLKDIGLTATNDARVAELGYPWYFRIIPTSLLWYHTLLSPAPVVSEQNKDTLTAYMANTFGVECRIDPKDATITFENEELKVVKSSSGGTCDYAELYGALEKVAATPNPEKIIVSGTNINPVVDDAKATSLLSVLVASIGDSVSLTVEGKVETIPKTTVYQWLDFKTEDTALVASVSAERGGAWLSEAYGSRLAVKPGVSTVTTRDFIETARVSGAPGRALDTNATTAQLTRFIRGETKTVAAVSKEVPATVVYTRSYSATDAGMAALMKHFAESHPGTYGISLVELSGARRHASYEGATQFTTASTFKLFVAYSTLLRIENGSWNWNDQISGGRDLARCFDDMIVKSDNPCAEALLLKIGFQAITSDARAIGATRTSFLGSNGIKSTADDEALLLSLLHSGQILSQQGNRDIWINALKRNIFRRGVPAGVPSAVVANKVGFLDGLLHDAAIVYSPTGTYVLVVLTNNSSWANIAELASQLEALRNGS